MSLRADRLSYGYGTRGAGIDAFRLRDVSVEVARGAFVGFLGPNGGGKTTLLALLAGVLTPREGRVLLDGVDLRGLTRRQVARRIAVVPQETHPAFDYTVLEMVLMGRHPHLKPLAVEGPEDIEIAQRALEATGTAAFADRSYMTLSGGEKQRVVIASALAQSADLLLLDEPTASLDLSYQLEIASLLRQLNRERGVTMVLATHDLNLAAAVCSDLVAIRGGTVLAQGRADAVLTTAGVRALYGVDAEVKFHEAAGHLTVVPLRRVRP